MDRSERMTSVERRLTANHKRRAKLEADLEAARNELRALLVEGRAGGMDVTNLAHRANISRETAHKLLRRG